MNWLELYKPESVYDLKTNKDEVKKAIDWIKRYKENPDETEKVLLILGPSGVGKTLLADLLFKEFNYDKIELNSSDVRSQKKISDFLKKSLTYRNIIDMFYEGKRPIGLLMDEIDTISKLSDKGGLSEFITILKMNDKHSNLKKQSLKKKKIKKIDISVADYIKLYNPIICTSNEINDKKINELKKYSTVIYLRQPVKDEIIMVINDICNKTNFKIDEKVKSELIEYTKKDIRKLIIFLENLYTTFQDKKINNILFEDFKKIFTEKEEDIQLFDSTFSLMNKKLSIFHSQLYFDIDCLLIPLMLYHNSIDYIKNCSDDNNKKLKIYNKILKCICVQDTVQTNIFESQEWNELYDISSFYGAAAPNFYFTELKSKNNKKEIQFTNLLNKISQMFVNKKLLIGAKYSFHKINLDLDEIIYSTEILSNYFDSYLLKLKDKNLLDEDDDDDDDIPIQIEEYENDNPENENDNPENENIQNENDENIILKKNVPIKKNDSELVKFMNKYQMGIDNLENILKIEKINLINEKRKKKFTLKIKKEISVFLEYC
jgi:DNA polymerase III delta prime subunit